MNCSFEVDGNYIRRYTVMYDPPITAATARDQLMGVCFTHWLPERIDWRLTATGLEVHRITFVQPKDHGKEEAEVT